MTLNSVPLFIRSFFIEQVYVKGLLRVVLLEYDEEQKCYYPSSHNLVVEIDLNQLITKIHCDKCCEEKYKFI